MSNLRAKVLLMVIATVIVTACVTLSESMQFVSDRHHSVYEPQACEEVKIMNESSVDAQGLDPERITFLNWNIYKGKGQNWQQDLAKFAKYHDVMTIQEAYLDTDLADLLKTHDLNWVMNTAFYLNGTAAGVMNAANTDSVHSCGFRLSEPIIRIPKSVLVSYYPLTGTRHHLLVANIHGINFSMGLRAYRKQLDMLYEAIRDHDGPMVVAGDFNSWSSERLEEVDKLIRRLSLSEIEYPVNNKTHVFGNAIDHVFYRQLEVRDDQVWQVSSSDHNPISVSFRLQNNLF